MLYPPIPIVGIYTSAHIYSNMRIDNTDPTYKRSLVLSTRALGIGLEESGNSTRSSTYYVSPSPSSRPSLLCLFPLYLCTLYTAANGKRPYVTEDSIEMRRRDAGLECAVKATQMQWLAAVLAQ